MMTVPSRLFIQATNIHNGGGATLLSSILSANFGRIQVFAQIDSRMLTPCPSLGAISVRRVKPSFLDRLLAEWWLLTAVTFNDTLLCLGNLPPLFSSKGHVVVYVHNRYLIDGVSLKGLSTWTWLRIWIERLLFRLTASHAHTFAVQTPSMQDLLNSSGLVQGRPVYVLPFLGSTTFYPRSLSYDKSKSETPMVFLNTCSGNIHKNHHELIQAWCLLAREDIYPILWLTIDETMHQELCAWILNKKKKCNLRLVNLGSQSHASIDNLYFQANALIFTSKLESLGLPLIEARQAGLPILAPELDYVRDVLDPDQSFDPNSAISISRAIKRFMRIDSSPLPLILPDDFIKIILEF